MERSELIDVNKCRKAAQALAMERINKDMTLCGKCFEVCPYTIKCINREKQCEAKNGRDKP
jgi:ferredoxin